VPDDGWNQPNCRLGAVGESYCDDWLKRRLIKQMEIRGFSARHQRRREKQNQDETLREMLRSVSKRQNLHQLSSNVTFETAKPTTQTRREDSTRWKDSLKIKYWCGRLTNQKTSSRKQSVRRTVGNKRFAFLSGRRVAGQENANCFFQNNNENEQFVVRNLRYLLDCAAAAFQFWFDGQRFIGKAESVGDGAEWRTVNKIARL